jgi:hypothetical protein
MSLEETHININSERRPRANSRGNYVEPMDALSIIIVVGVATLISVCVVGLFIEIFSVL